MCFSLRDSIIYTQGFTLLTTKFINSLASYLKGKKVLEVMSGCGALSYCLKNEGIDIIATDNYDWENKNKWYQLWTDIEFCDAVDAVRNHNDVDIIIMSWAYMDDVAYSVLETMRNENPKCKLLFIGETQGGCTEDAQFYDNINYIDDSYIEYINRKIFKQWEGIHDELILCN